MIFLRTVLYFSIVCAALAQPAPLTITTQSLPFGSVGIPYSAGLKAAGGSGAYTWSIVQGALPPGLTLDAASGSISGTPTADGAYSVVFKVTDRQTQQSGTKGFGIGIAQITNASPLPGALVGTFYSLTFNATDAPGPFAWSISAGQLPAGLTLDQSKGVLSGTPTTPGTYNFNVTAFSDRAGAGATKGFALAVSATLAITTDSPLAAGNVGTSYAVILSATGGAPPYSFSVIASPFGQSQVPPGLVLNPNGILSGTPTVAGTFSFNALVTDSQGTQASKLFTLTITPALTFAPSSPLPDGVVGQSYSQSIQASGGSAPYTFSLFGQTLPPPGLTFSSSGVISGTPSAAGTFNFTVQVTDAEKVTATAQLQISIANAAPLLRISPLSLQFLGERAPPQVVTITSNSATPVNFAVQIDGGSANTPAPSWLSVTPLGGATPGMLTVRVNALGLAAGAYAARILISVPRNAGQAPIAVSVTLTLATAPPHLNVSPGGTTVLRFAGHVQTPAILEQAIAVSHSGGVGPVGFIATLLGHSSWITDITPGGGQTAANSIVLVRVRVNTQGLQVGSYRDTIRISSLADSADVPVSLFVSDAGPLLAVNVTGLLFEARQGAGSATPKQVEVLDLGDPGTTVHWTASLADSVDWLSLGSTSGTASPNNPGTLTLAPTASAANLAPGGHYALVQISDPQALNSPQYVVAVLDIADAGAAPVPEPAPAGLFFAGPGSQAVRVFTSSASPVAFQAATDGSSWLSLNAATGATSTQSPGQIVVSVNVAGLTPGIYTGGVNIAIGAAVRTVNVTLVVPPPARSAAMPEASQASGCTPTRLALTNIGFPNSFATPAGWPATLIVQVNDDCGGPVLAGSVFADFSNGDPTLSLASDAQSGVYSATWQPGRVTSSMTVTARAIAGALQPATAELIGSVVDNQSHPPVLALNGTLNNLYPSIGAPLAPGAIAQVFGSDLASLTSSPGVVPLVSAFNGTEMLVGPLDAPLYFLSGPQINVQIPAELTPNRQYVVLVKANGARTLPQMIDVVPFQPGVAAFANGGIIAQHTDFSLVEVIHPARTGEVLTIYLVGMGPTNPSVRSGAPAPGSAPLAVVSAQPSVTVDGNPSEIFFAGLTPGAVGLYQINFRVPAARSGSVDLVVTQNGIAANPTKLPVQ
jgi:uncharacterized protein (TIGR03437 family)